MLIGSPWTFEARFRRAFAFGVHRSAFGEEAQGLPASPWVNSSLTFRPNPPRLYSRPRSRFLSVAGRERVKRSETAERRARRDRICLRMKRIEDEDDDDDETSELVRQHFF
jgi:hypothetical protein